MPLIINVGVSRKASKDFQSAGYSLNPTAELDQGLLGILLGCSRRLNASTGEQRSHWIDRLREGRTSGHRKYCLQRCCR